MNTFGWVFPLADTGPDAMLALQYVDPEYREDSPLPPMAILRLVAWEWTEASHYGFKERTRTIANIKEQEVRLIRECDALSGARVQEYLLAWGIVMCDVLTAIAALGHGCNGRMPQDFCFPDSNHPLALKTCNTYADFEQALRVRTRLGKYLIPASEGGARGGLG